MSYYHKIKKEFEITKTWINCQKDKEIIWNFFKTYNPNYGYLNCNHNIIKRIKKAMLYRNHSGNSLQ